MEPIAIIGTGCRFPGAQNPEAFWQLLRGGGNAVREVPSERWDCHRFLAPQPAPPGKSDSPWGGFLAQLDRFDPQFFGISPREAEYLDPQQRLLLEVSWEALENAAVVPHQLSGTPTGVFIGISGSDYDRLGCRDFEKLCAYSATGTSPGVAANRISYCLNLRGPSLGVDTACSSSLVAVHLACQSLAARESNLCLVGGVSLMLWPGPWISFAQARMLAADGRCKTFDAAADGYVRGEGCGVVLLKRLADALADGNKIEAVIRGSAVNQDGTSNGLTAPNGPAQQAVIRQALSRAGVQPAEISYVEAHGTGTALGDPIEVKALKSVLLEGRDPHQPCWLGSVKTNIGHLEAAAGIAGLIKVVLQLQHKELVPHLHLQRLNPYIRLQDTPLAIPTHCQPWQSDTSSLLAGVSSFGFGGTNAHVILEAAPDAPLPVNPMPHPWELLTLSAKTESALGELAGRYRQFLSTRPDVALADICVTANTGREQFDHRAALLAASKEQLHQQLGALAAGEESPGVFRGQLTSRKATPVVWWFGDGGWHHLNWGRQLYQEEAVFRASLDRCGEILEFYLDKPLLEIIYPSELGSQNSEFRSQELGLSKTSAAPDLHQTPEASVAWFVLEYALAQLWLSWGVKPTAVVGRGVGEYVAACVAEVLSLEDGLRLVMARERGMEVAGNGSGAKMGAEWAAVARQCVYSAPNLEVISAVTGESLRAEMGTAEYWCGGRLESGSLAAGVEGLARRGYPLVLAMSAELSGKQLPHQVRVVSGGGGRRELWGSLARLYVLGVGVNWSAVAPQPRRPPIPLPTYPFQRQRCWIETARQEWQASKDLSTKNSQTPIVKLLDRGDIPGLTQLIASSGNLSPEKTELLPELLQTLVQQHQQQLGAAPIADGLYEIEWQSQPHKVETDSAKTATEEPSTWLIFADRGGVGLALAQVLQSQGHNCILVYRGQTCEAKETGVWSLNPSRRGDFEHLFERAVATSQIPLSKVIHLWSLDIAVEPTISSLKHAQLWGCGSVLHLVRMLTALRDGDRSISPQLWLVTQNAVSIAGSIPAIARSPLWGLGKTIALESPQLWGGAIDLATETTAAATAILTEINNSEAEDQIALRGAERYVARLVRTQAIETQPLPLKPNSTYLITGGLGALGIKVARWMVDRGVRYLVLIGRSKVSLPAREQIAEMEESGAKILVANADVAEPEDMEKIFTKIEETMPPLRGVVHGAGVSGYQAITEIEPELLEVVFRPKMLGGWILHQLTRTMELDFLVSFSSIASVWGSSGQAHYGAANYFLDSLAHYRRGLGLAALTANWGPWAGEGMAVKEFQTQLTRRGIKALPPERAIATLEELLKTSHIQVTVAEVDWQLFKELYESRQRRPFLERIETPANIGVEREKTSKSEILEQLTQAPKNDRRAILIAFLQTEVADILKLESSQLPSPQQGFFAMGMDSLMAVELKRRLENAFDSSLPGTLAFESPTIQDLAEYIATEVLGWELIGKDKDVALSPSDEEESLALSRIESLPADELEVSIAQQLAKLENLMEEA